MTTQDYSGADMTVVDFPFGFPISLSSGNGSGYVTKTVGDIPLRPQQPALYRVHQLEVVSVTVRDPNGNVFAVPGARYWSSRVLTRPLTCTSGFAWLRLQVRVPLRTSSAGIRPAAGSQSVR